MLVVKVELHSANTGEVTELARMHICNEGGSNDIGNYGAYVLRGRSEDSLDVSDKNRIYTRTGKLEGYPRLRLHVWNLVLCSLLCCGYRGTKNPEAQGQMKV